jgi:DNA-binding response OmpR family regulator
MSPEARVLVVDDDESIREYVDMALSEEGYEVITAPHGAAALDAIAQSPPDLILLDMRMPVMDGREFSQAYRRTADVPAPIVVLTASRDVSSSANEIRADGAVAKPFDLDELLETVRVHCRRK